MIVIAGGDDRDGVRSVPNPIEAFGCGALLRLCLRLATNPTAGFGFGAFYTRCGSRDST
jgi:hypothetical protein